MNPATDLLDKYRVDYRLPGQHHHCTHGWVQLDCVRCSPNSQHFRMGWNQENGYFSCWVCGFVPTPEVFRALFPGEPWKEIWDGSDFTRAAHRGRAHEVIGRLKVPNGVRPMGEFHREYLKSRGFSPRKIAGVWEVEGLHGDAEQRLRWRLYVPVHQGGQVVTWTTRSINPHTKGPRYLAARPEDSAVVIDACLYGLDHCRTDVVVVCEGPPDVWAVGPGAVALFGVRASAAQLHKLSRFSRRVVCLDSEPDAQVRAGRLFDDLSALPGETVRVVLETGKDPAGADPDEVAELRRRFLGDV